MTHKNLIQKNIELVGLVSVLVSNEERERNKMRNRNWSGASIEITQKTGYYINGFSNDMLMRWDDLLCYVGVFLKGKVSLLHMWTCESQMSQWWRAQDDPLTWTYKHCKEQRVHSHEL